MPVETPPAWRCAHVDPPPAPTVVTYWLDLVALDGEAAHFASEQHGGRHVMPVPEWIGLGRPGRVETSTVAR